MWVADALSRSVDGFLLLGCRFDENYQCQFIKGSELADYRFGKVQETLSKVRLDAGKCEMIRVAINDYERLPDIISEFVKKVEELGPNPFKGF